MCLWVVLCTHFNILASFLFLYLFLFYSLHLCINFIYHKFSFPKSCQKTLIFFFFYWTLIKFPHRVSFWFSALLVYISCLPLPSSYILYFLNLSSPLIFSCINPSLSFYRFHLKTSEDSSEKIAQRKSENDVGAISGDNFYFL